MRLLYELELFPRSRHAAPPATWRLKLGTLLFALAVVCLCAFAGCARVAAGTPPTAPTDPYAKALLAVNVFSQALGDAQSTLTTLHTTLVFNGDGTRSPILSDAAYAKVQIGLKLFASDGIALSGLLASRASAATISTRMAALTANLSTQLSPAAVGITNETSQAKYVVVTSILSAALTTVAVAVSQIPATEALHVRDRDSRPYPVVVRACAHDPYLDRTDSVGGPSFEASRSQLLTRPDQRQLREGARLLSCAGLFGFDAGFRGGRFSGAGDPPGRG